MCLIIVSATAAATAILYEYILKILFIGSDFTKSHAH